MKNIAQAAVQEWTVTAMTKHEAYEYWLMRYNKAKDYDDPHWDAEERVAHHRWLEAMEQAMETLKDTSVSVDDDTVKLKKGVKKFRAENYVIYDVNYLLENLAREVYLLMGAIHDGPKRFIDEFRQRLIDEEIVRQINSQPIKPLKIDKEGEETDNENQKP